MRTINFIDLFDFEKESDKQYYALISHKTEEIYQWEQEEYNKRLPTIINIYLPLENDNTREIHRDMQERI